ncbi:MAG: DUF3524 domain-containing protein [Candidatus Cloacimonetes bacterium]|nr:DUF3524 domain-containing protein [Candidatus Cloacimonadota bacterium]
MKILLLEAFYGGSHKTFVDTFVKYSCHDIDLITLPGRFFKWRTRGAAYYFIDQIKDISKYDLIFCGSMMSVADLVSHFRQELNVPIVSYFHETQFAYPIKQGEKFDVQYGLNDVATAKASDYCIFNSMFHKEQFLSDTKKYLSKMPDYQPLWLINDIDKKSQVIYPCSDFTSNIEKYDIRQLKQNGLLNIVYNHRWEHDKNPEEFFNVLVRVAKKGYNFNLYVLGESYKNSPEIFEWAKKQLSNHIMHFGYVESKQDYYKILALSDLVISTSWQENYGISVVEAMSFGCLALLPKRLSYPELLNDERLSAYMYADLEQSLIKVLEMSLEDIDEDKQKFVECMKRFETQNLVAQLDQLFVRVT